MAFAALSEINVVQVAWRAAFTELALILLLVLHVIWLRVSRGIAERREQRIIEAWRPRLLGALEDDGGDVHRLRDADAPTVLLLWNEHQSLLQGESRDHLAAFATRTGLARAAGRMLQRGGLQNRLIALTALGNLGDRSAWLDVRRLAEDPNPYLSLTAAKALMRIDANASAPTVVRLLARRTEWSPARVAAMLREVQADAFSARLAAEASRSGARCSSRFVRLLELCHPHEGLPAARRVLDQTKDEETICACLRVLGHFRDPQDLGRARTLTSHPSPNVRIRAVTALGAIAGSDESAAIARMLSDPEWWVRYRAAQALANLPGMSSQRLLEVRAQQADPFARDILDHVFAETALQ